jgi:hypothetical protein
MKRRQVLRRHYGWDPEIVRSKRLFRPGRGPFILPQLPAAFKAKLCKYNVHGSSSHDVQNSLNSDRRQRKLALGGHWQE